MALTGIGAFAGGALEGYDASLSRFALIERERRAREIARQNAQHQALQSLISGVGLASTHPDVAEQALADPRFQDILPAAPIKAGVEQARTLRRGGARLSQGMGTGEIDMADPDLQALVATDPKKFGEIITNMRKEKLRADILADRTLSPQGQVRALMAAGIDVPAHLMNAAMPQLPAGITQATKEAEYGVDLGAPAPGQKPRLQQRTEMIKRSESDVGLEDAPGRPGVSRNQAEASGRAIGTAVGTTIGEMAPLPEGMRSPEGIAQSGLRTRSLARETPFQQALVEARLQKTQTEDPKDAAVRQLSGVALQGYYYDAPTKQTIGPGQARQLGTVTGRRPMIPETILHNGKPLLVFHIPPVPARFTPQQEEKMLRDLASKYIGKQALTGRNPDGTPIITTITPDVFRAAVMGSQGQ